MLKYLLFKNFIIELNLKFKIIECKIYFNNLNFETILIIIHINHHYMYYIIIKYIIHQVLKTKYT